MIGAKQPTTPTDATPLGPCPTTNSAAGSQGSSVVTATTETPDSAGLGCSLREGSGERGIRKLRGTISEGTEARGNCHCFRVCQRSRVEADRLNRRGGRRGAQVGCSDAPRPAGPCPKVTRTANQHRRGDNKSNHQWMQIRRRQPNGGAPRRHVCTVRARGVGLGWALPRQEGGGGTELGTRMATWYVYSDVCTGSSPLPGRRRVSRVPLAGQFETARAQSSRQPCRSAR